MEWTDAEIHMAGSPIDYKTRVLHLFRSDFSGYITAGWAESVTALRNYMKGRRNAER